MFGRARKPPVVADVVPWDGDGVDARFALLPVVRRRDVPSVVLTLPSGESRQFHSSEVRKLADRRIGIAESVDHPIAFLCWPEAASRDSSAGDLVGDMDRDTLALLVEPVEEVAMTLTGPHLESFRTWARGLPG